MRTEHNHRDLVYDKLFGSSLIDGYQQVWSNGDYIIYATHHVAHLLAQSPRRPASDT